MRFVIASVILLFIWATPAAADLYRWRDPETGSVKFSSYPPPWYGDAAKQRRAPKVELIPARSSDSVAKPETPGRPQEGSARRDEAQTNLGKPAKAESR